MARLTRRLFGGIITALLIGVGGPMLDVLYKCRESRARIDAVCGPAGRRSADNCPMATSEACVWSKSLLPVSIAASVLFLGLPAGAVAYWLAGRRPTSPRGLLR
jgi:hypothetical protein